MGAGEVRRGPVWKGSALLLLLVCSACAGRRPPAGAPDVPRADAAFTARFSGSLEWRGKGVPLSGLLAVVPDSGARLEIRNPLGGVLLVVFVGPRACTLLRPTDGAQATWDAAGGEFPFAARDLWFLLSGCPPAESMDTRSRGGVFEARWRNEGGWVDLAGRASETGPAPFTKARMRGPRGAELRMTLGTPEARTVPEEALRPPAPAAETASPSELLKELVP